MDQTIEPTVTNSTAAKPRRKRTAPRQPTVPKESPMAGITVQDCPTACRADRCVISCAGICAHPHKGGLQARLQTPDTLRRFNEAKRVLGKAKLDLT